jgi:hypothetical protein
MIVSMRTIDLEIEVTRRHIQTGTNQHAKQCPIAVAIKESDPDIAWVEVRERKPALIRIAYHSDQMEYRFKTPPEARTFVRAFDRGEPVRAFTLKLYHDDFVSARPRRLKQHQKAEKREVVNFIAKVRNKLPDEVTDEDIAATTEELAQPVPVRRARTRVTQTAQRTNSQRPVIGAWEGESA